MSLAIRRLLLVGCWGSNRRLEEVEGFGDFVDIVVGFDRIGCFGPFLAVVAEPVNRLHMRQGTSLSLHQLRLLRRLIHLLV